MISQGFEAVLINVPDLVEVMDKVYRHMSVTQRSSLHQIFAATVQSMSMPYPACRTHPCANLSTYGILSCLMSDLHAMGFEYCLLDRRVCPG